APHRSSTQRAAVTHDPDLFELLAQITRQSEAPLEAVGLGWARALPAVTLVPAFGLGAIPAPVRAALGLSIGLCIAPAREPLTRAPDMPFALAFAEELAKGLPVALLAALALWTAAMVGGLTDNLRGGRETLALPNVDADDTPLGALLSMLVSILFLEG